MIKAISIGASAGGVTALNYLFKSIPENFRLPIVVVLHVGDKQFIPTAFHVPKGMQVKEADEKEEILPGTIYFAPAGYHLLVENDFTFSLTVEEKVQFARPSIDVTMHSLAQAYGENLLGIVLTGANEDGADGLAYIKNHKGLTMVQDPADSEYSTMPMAAVRKATPHYTLPLKEIAVFVASLEGSL